MNSEKVKEIKEWLENESEVYRNEICYNASVYINDLESENERYKQSCGAIGQNSLTIINQLKDRIAELEKENETKTDTITDLLKKQEFYEKEKLTKFAESYRKKLDEQKRFYETASISHRDISLTALNTAYRCLDETLKEFINKGE